MAARTAPHCRDIRRRLVFLGSGTSHGVPVIGCPCSVCTSTDPRDRRTRCSAVLGLSGGNLLIDSSPEMRIQLLREGIGLIDAVLYTHEHSDHLLGLDDLRIFPEYLGHDLPIFCSAATEARIRRVFDYAFDPETRNYPAGGIPRLAFHRVGDAPFEVLGSPVVPIPLRHGRYEATGYRFGDLAYITDANGIPPESEAKLQGLDVLVLDCLRHRPHATHFCLEESLAVVERLRPRRTLFTHMSHDLPHAATSAELPPGVELAYDGLTVEVAGV